LRRVSNSEREVTARTVPMVVRLRDAGKDEYSQIEIEIEFKTSETAGDCHIIYLV